MEGMEAQEANMTKIEDLIKAYNETSRQIRSLTCEQADIKIEIVKFAVAEKMFGCLDINFSKLSRMAGTPNPRYMR
jgi:flagellar capping protein FliD